MTNKVVLTEAGGQMVGHPEGTEIVPSKVIFKEMGCAHNERQFTIPIEGKDPATLGATVFLRNYEYEEVD